MTAEGLHRPPASSRSSLLGMRFGCRATTRSRSSSALVGAILPALTMARGKGPEDPRDQAPGGSRAPGESSPADSGGGFAKRFRTAPAASAGAATAQQGAGSARQGAGSARQGTGSGGARAKSPQGAEGGTLGGARADPPPGTPAGAGALSPPRFEPESTRVTLKRKLEAAIAEAADRAAAAAFPKGLAARAAAARGVQPAPARAHPPSNPFSSPELGLGQQGGPLLARRPPRSAPPLAEGQPTLSSNQGRCDGPFRRAGSHGRRREQRRQPFGKFGMMTMPAPTQLTPRGPWMPERALTEPSIMVSLSSLRRPCFSPISARGVAGWSIPCIHIAEWMPLQAILWTRCFQMAAGSLPKGVTVRARLA